MENFQVIIAFVPDKRFYNLSTEKVSCTLARSFRLYWTQLAISRFHAHSFSFVCAAHPVDWNKTSSAPKSKHWNSTHCSHCVGDSKPISWMKLFLIFWQLYKYTLCATSHGNINLLTIASKTTNRWEPSGVAIMEHQPTPSYAFGRKSTHLAVSEEIRGHYRKCMRYCVSSNLYLQYETKSMETVLIIGAESIRLQG